MENSKGDSSDLVLVGIDFGGDSCRVSVVDRSGKITLHVNRVSNRQTPALVSFDKRLRIYGEEAEARSSTLFKNTIPLLSYIVGLDNQELEEFVRRRKYLFSLVPDKETGCFKVTFDEAQLDVHPVEAFSFFVNKVLETVRNEFNLSPETGNDRIRLSISVPTYLSEKFKKCIHKSLSISRFKEVKLFKETECILKRWSDSQLPDAYHEYLKLKNVEKEDPMKVAFLDVGFVHTTFFVAEVTPEDSALTAKILCESSTDEVGAYQVVESLADYVEQLIENVCKVKLKMQSRQSYYLYKSCVKCVKELSLLNDAKLDVERVLENDEDYTTNVTRTKLEQLTQPIKEKLCKLVEDVLGKTDRENYLSLEILGGGSRIPFIKEVANKYSDSLKCLRKTRTSLDTTSAVSYGATQLLKQYHQALEHSPQKETEQKETKNQKGDEEDVQMKDVEMKDQNEQVEEEGLREYMEKEMRIQSVEREQTLKLGILNEMENFVIKTKSDLWGNYKDLVEESKLNEAEEMLRELQNFSCEGMSDKSLDSSRCQEELRKAQEKLKDLAPKYVEKLEEDRLKKLQEERETSNYTGSYKPKEFDMDVVLPNKTCIKRAQKNKEEGNELIGAGNVELAVQHYIKVIQYCAKVSNPTEEEKTTVNDLRLASNLNLAMCYLKMDVPASWNKAVSCCTSALSISPTNTKALFRRAVAYEKLNDLDNAIKDANRGVELDSNNQDFKNKEARYRRRVERLTEKVKYALFFAHTASYRARKNEAVKVDSIRTQYQPDTVDTKDLDSCSDSTNLDQTYDPLFKEPQEQQEFRQQQVDQPVEKQQQQLKEQPKVEQFEKQKEQLDQEDDDDEYEDQEDLYGHLDDSGPEVAQILKSTKESKDDLITKLNFSYTNPAQVKSVYGLSPIDYRINSLRDSLTKLNNIYTENAV